MDGFPSDMVSENFTQFARFCAGSDDSLSSQWQDFLVAWIQKLRWFCILYLVVMTGLRSVLSGLDSRNFAHYI